MRLPRTFLLALLAAAASACGDSKPAAKPEETKSDKTATETPAATPAAPSGSGLDLASLQAKADAEKGKPSPAPPPPPAGKEPAKAPPVATPPAAPPEAAKEPEKPATPEGPPPPGSPSDITDSEVLSSWSDDEKEALNALKPADRAKEMQKKRMEIFLARGGVLQTGSGKLEDSEVDPATGMRGPARPDAPKAEDVAPSDLQGILYDLGSKDPEIRARGAEAAKRFPDKAVAALHVRKILQDPDAEMRAIAADTLGALKQPSAVGDLEKVLARKEPDPVRNAVLKALREIGGREAVAALRNQVLEGREPSDQATALGMLVGLKEVGEVRDLLKAALADVTPDVRQAAAAAIGVLEIKDYEKELVGLLKDFSDNVTIEAMRALGATNGRSAVGELVKLIQKPHEDADDPTAIQNAANLALEKITGVKQGYSDTLPEPERLATIDAWRVWWNKNKATWK